MGLKNWILLFALILLCCTVFAETTQINFEWQSMTTIVLDKETFMDNEPITGKIFFNNLEKYPSLGTKIVLHLAKGEYYYPSQLNSNENILEEKIFNMDFVLPLSGKEVSFSLTNPGKGDFRVDTYIWVVKSKAGGASNIFYNPSIKNFSVSGVEKEKAVINRALTKFNGVVGPLGFPVTAGSKFKGIVVIDNNTSIKKSNLVLGIKLCEWASAFCENVTETKFVVSPMQINEQGFVEVELIAPKLPSAYEISIVLYDGTLIESIYKNRVIVSGGTAKVRKIFLNGIEDRNYSINVIIMGSPDHFSYPDFDNFESKLEIFDGEKVIEEKSISIEKIKTGDIFEEKYLVDANYFTKFCAKIIKENIVYENECFKVDLNKLLTEYEAQHPTPIDIKWNYDEFSKNLSITLKRSNINVQVRLFDSDQTYFKEMIKTQGEYSTNIQIEKMNLFLAVNDFDLKVQQLIPLNLALLSSDAIIYGDTTDPNANMITQKKCSGVICSENTVCSAKTELTIEGDCCYSECVSNNISSDESITIPLILWVALIVLILAIVMIYEVTKKRRKRK